MNRRELLAGLLAAPLITTLPTQAVASGGWDMISEAWEIAAKYALFEFNDETTRNQVKIAMKPFCDHYGFYMKCDEDNNTPLVIDRNEFVAEFYKDGQRRIYTIASSTVNYDEVFLG